MYRNVIKHPYLIFLIFLVSILGLCFRFWNINFGLPHSYYADEPEISGFAIQYANYLKDAISHNDWYKLVPVSYVYGMFPIYLLTVFVVPFNKVTGLLHVSVLTSDIYLYLRYVNALLSFFIVPLVSFLSYKLFFNKGDKLENKKLLVFSISFILLSLNWKLIAHAHYSNADIFLTLLLSISYLLSYLYYSSNEAHLKKKGTQDKSPGMYRGSSFYTLLNGLVFGFAVGTKVTALITYPLYVYLYIKNKDYRGLVGFSFLILGGFILSNPFSIIFAGDFVFRIYSMLFREAGLVFDSIDTNPLKYIFSLSFISTVPVFIFSLLGFGKSLSTTSKSKEGIIRGNLTFHLFLFLNIIVYLLFYSIQSRRVDRWLLPILPILIMYASYYTSDLLIKIMHFKKLFIYLIWLLLIGIFLYYSYFLYIVLSQFTRNTPRTEAYLYMRNRISDESPKMLVYTEEGLDPFSKIKYADVIKFNVYESLGANLFYPNSPYRYKYIVISSRAMENFKKDVVKDTYPTYSYSWYYFEDTLKSSNFELIKSFELPNKNLNLIPLSNIYIYENLTYTDDVIRE